MRDSSGSLNFAIVGSAADGDMVGVFVVRVTPNSPAATAGLTAGDRILSVNGQSCESLSSTSVLDMLQAAGDSVKLTVQSQPDGFEHIKSIQATSAFTKATATIRRPATSSSSSSLAAAAPTAAAAAASAVSPSRRRSTFTAPRRITLNRNGGPLGFKLIGPSSNDMPSAVFISEIKSGTQSEKAGLRAGDRILAINFQAVTDYPTCAALISKLRAEIVLDVEYDPSAFQRQITGGDVPIVRLGELYVNTKDVYRVMVDEVDWAIRLLDYNPPQHTAPDAVRPNSDPLVPAPETVFNDFDNGFGVERRSLTGEYEVRNGLPLNPSGRTGLAGRGALPRWGPNHSVCSVVTRWSRDLSIDNKRVLEFVAIKVPQSAAWGLPFAMVEDLDVDPAQAHQEVFGVQVLGITPQMPGELRKKAQDTLTTIFKNASYKAELYASQREEKRAYV